jgi:hypothetical protein
VILVEQQPWVACMHARMSRDPAPDRVQCYIVLSMAAHGTSQASGTDCCRWVCVFCCIVREKPHAARLSGVLVFVFFLSLSRRRQEIGH